jgi:hypothetical protein
MHLNPGIVTLATLSLSIDKDLLKVDPEGQCPGLFTRKRPNTIERVNIEARRPKGGASREGNFHSDCAPQPRLKGGVKGHLPVKHLVFY